MKNTPQKLENTNPNESKQNGLTLSKALKTMFIVCCLVFTAIINAPVLICVLTVIATLIVGQSDVKRYGWTGTTAIVSLMAMALGALIPVLMTIYQAPFVCAVGFHVIGTMVAEIPVFMFAMNEDEKKQDMFVQMIGRAIIIVTMLFFMGLSDSMDSDIQWLTLYITQNATAATYIISRILIYFLSNGMAVLIAASIKAITKHGQVKDTTAFWTRAKNICVDISSSVSEEMIGPIGSLHKCVWKEATSSKKTK